MADCRVSVLNQQQPRRGLTYNSDYSQPGSRYSGQWHGVSEACKRVAWFLLKEHGVLLLLHVERGGSRAGGG